MHPSIGKLYVVATPIGNLDDLSQRAKDILGGVTWIAAEDTRHSAGLLKNIGVTTTLISYHDHNERDRVDQLILKLKQGENGALISDAGTPLVSDPGYLLVGAAHKAGINVIPIPGPCAAIAALSASGLPTDKFFFEGFLPAKQHARQNRLAMLKESPYTLVFYEAPHRILSILEDAVAVMGLERQATIAREITKKFESIRLGSLSELLGWLRDGTIPEKGEFVLIIEGQDKKSLVENEEEMERVLNVLMPEMPLKQAVQIAVKLTGLPKNALYDYATKMKERGPAQGPAPT